LVWLPKDEDETNAIARRDEYNYSHGCLITNLELNIVLNEIPIFQRKAQ
jgi:hypothetical protein